MNGREQNQGAAIAARADGLHECDNCGEHRACWRMQDSGAVQCVPCIRAGFEHAAAHCEPEIEERPQAWAQVFREIGEPLPWTLAEWVAKANGYMARGHK